MKIRLINYLVCPFCHSPLGLLIRKKIKERLIDGELRCKKCRKKFYIKNGITCFASCVKKEFERGTKKLRKITIEQEIPKKWMKSYSKQEIGALKKEWKWMLSVIPKRNSAIHLDFATGTGRFLRNIILETKGEIVALDNGYGTCQELQYFLKKIRKYSRVSIICADARKMPFKEDVFDSVSSWHGLDEPKMKNAIKETKRVLKKWGGLVVSGIHYQKGSKSFLLAKKHGTRFLTKEEIIEIFKENNFCKIQQKIFFEGYGSEKDVPLPVFGDFYSVFAIKAEK